MQPVNVPGVGVVNFPDGMSQEDIVRAIEKDILPSQRPSYAKSFGKGLEGMLSSGRTAVESLFGSPEEAALRAQEREKVAEGEYPEQVGLEQVKKAYEEKGLLGGAKEVVRQIPHAIAEQLPQLGTTLGAGAAGRAIGAVAGAPFGGPVGSAVGATIGGLFGMVLPSLVQQFGSNIERQAKEQQKEGKPLDISLGAAGAASIPQAALDAVETRFLLGSKMFGSLIGRSAEAVTKLPIAQAQKLAEDGLMKTLAKGTARGVVSEVPTEVTQQMLERLQAGLPLATPDALVEYGDTAYQTALLGPLGIPGQISARAAARQQIAPAPIPAEETPPTEGAPSATSAAPVEPANPVVDLYRANPRRGVKSLATELGMDEEEVRKTLEAAGYDSAVRKAAYKSGKLPEVTPPVAPEEPTPGTTVDKRTGMPIADIKSIMAGATARPGILDTVEQAIAAVPEVSAGKLPSTAPKEKVEVPEVKAPKVEAPAEKSPPLDQAIKAVRGYNQPLLKPVKFIQDALGIKYGPAVNIVSQLEKAGIISGVKKTPEGVAYRDVVTAAPEPTPAAPAAPTKITDADLKQMGIAAPKLRADLKKLDVSTPEGYTAFMDTLGGTKSKVNWAQAEAFAASLPRPEGVAEDVALPQKPEPKEAPSGTRRETGGEGAGVSVSQPPAERGTPSAGVVGVGTTKGPASLPVGGKKERAPALKKETPKQQAARLEREADTTEADIQASLEALDQPISQSLYEAHLDYLTQTPEAAERLAAAGVPKTDLEASKARVAKIGQTVDTNAKARAITRIERLKDELSEAEHDFNRAKEAGQDTKNLESEVASLNERIKTAKAEAKALGVDLRTKRVGIKHVRKPSGKQTRASMGPAGRPTGNTAVEVVKSLERTMRPDSGLERVTTVVQSEDQLPEAIRQSPEYAPGVKGVAHRGRIWLVADNIPHGRELGVFLHEAGAHIGFDKVLKPGQREFLANQVRNWARGNDLKGEAAKVALAKGKTSSDEIIAYAVEELVNRGVKPVGLRPESTWLKRVLDAFKAALRRVGLQQQITEQELVDLAFGAAHIAVKTPIEEGLAPGARFSTGSTVLDAAIVRRGEDLAALKEKPFWQQLMNSKDRQRLLDRFRVHVEDVQAAVKRKLLDAGDIEPLLLLSLATRAMDTAVTSMLHGAIKLRTVKGGRAKVFTVSEGPSLATVHEHVQNIAKKLGGGKISKESFQNATRIFDLGAIVSRLKSLPQTERELYKFRPADLAAGEEALRIYGDDIRAGLDAWTKYKNGLLDAAKAAGRFTAEDVEAWQNAADFVPWYRKLDDAEQGHEVKSSARQFFRGLQDPGSIKELMGGDVEKRPIGDILNNMEQLSFWLVNATIKNHAAVQTIDALGDATEVGSPTAAGVDKARVVRVFRGGQLKFYEMGDILDAYAFTGVQDVTSPILRALSKASNVLRKGTTLMPGFVVSQVFQDAFRVTTLSGVERPFAAGANTFSEFFKAFKNDAVAKEFAFHGIIGQPDFVFEGERSRLRAGLDETKTGAQRTASMMFKALDKMTRASDAAQRRAIYKQVIDTTGDEALALYKANEIINFQIRGRSGTISVLRQVVPFVNAYIQGMSVALRTMAGHGVSVGDKAKAMRAFYASAIKVAALTSLYAYLVGGDDEYEKTPDHEKISSFIIPGTREMVKQFTGEDPGGNIRIPVPSDPLGLMMKALPEIAVNYITKEGTKEKVDATKLRRMLAAATSNALLPPNVTPQLLKPTVEVFFNKSFFTGRPIVGKGIEDREKSQQFVSSTSTLARVLGEYMPLAPVQIDHLMRGYLGIGGSTVVWAASEVMDANVPAPRPSSRLNEIPQIRTFLTGRETSGMKEDYYELRGKANEVNRTINTLKLRDPEALREYATKNKELYMLQKSGVFSFVDKTFSEIRMVRDIIDNNKNMPPEQKREAFDKLDQAEVLLLSKISLPGLRKLANL